MLLATYAIEEEVALGILHEDRVYAVPLANGASTLDVIRRWPELRSGLEDRYTIILRGQAEPVDGARLLAPINCPVRNAFCVAGNYEMHVKRTSVAIGQPLRDRTQAIFFTKPTGTLIGPYDDIEVDPTITSAVDYELELAIVMGRGGRNIRTESAMEFVFGFTIVNDVSARDIQVVTPTTDYLRGKGLDTFFPMGPAIIPKEYGGDYRDYAMRLYVNGEMRQTGSPSMMLRSVEELVAELSRGLTLMPGDILRPARRLGSLLRWSIPATLPTVMWFGGRSRRSEASKTQFGSCASDRTRSQAGHQHDARRTSRGAGRRRGWWQAPD